MGGHSDGIFHVARLLVRVVERGFHHLKGLLNAFLFLSVTLSWAPRELAMKTFSDLHSTRAHWGPSIILLPKATSVVQI